jgi:hypothetical protein
LSYYVSIEGRACRQGQDGENPMTIYTYTPDMTRPDCPVCGSPVPQETNEPEIPWQGTCRAGHAFIFQLEDEDEDEDED